MSIECAERERDEARAMLLDAYGGDASATEIFQHAVKHYAESALSTANARVAELEKAAKAVEDWWMSSGMAIMERAGEVGAPYAIFMTRAALTEVNE